MEIRDRGRTQDIESQTKVFWEMDNKEYGRQEIMKDKNY